MTRFCFNLFHVVFCSGQCTRWAPTTYKWSYNLHEWPYKWITGVTTPISGVILLITGRGLPRCQWEIRGFIVNALLTWKPCRYVKRSACLTGNYRCSLFPTILSFMTSPHPVNESTLRAEKGFFCRWKKTCTFLDVSNLS